MPSISDNVFHIQQKIREYEIRYERKPHSVKLLAVTKKQSIEKISEAIEANQIAFGENYLQEALPKMEFFKNVEWHFIGSIQRNKTRKIAEHFSWVQSVDSFLIAERLNEQRPAQLPPLNICLEVNISEQASKSGMHADEILQLAKQCETLPRLKLRGLMAVPEPKSTLEEQRAEFHKIQILFNHLLKNGLNLDTLSIGMTDDMEAAIAEGSTMVRIGTGIFGKRDNT
jgi:pyridoxal phosphate enzyme (YggS family)